jgi:hypothetical protein
MKIFGKSILLLLIINCNKVISQNLFVRSEYKGTKVENRTIAILPIIDSIWTPSPSWSLFKFRDKDTAIDFKSAIHRYLPAEMAAVSNNKFSFVDVDYTQGLAPRSTRIDRNTRSDTAVVYFPKIGEPLTTLDTLYDIAIILYGLGFQSSEGKAGFPLGGAVSLTISSFKGKMYGYCIVWDHKQNRVFAQGRLNVNVRLSGENFKEEDMKAILRVFATEFVKKTPLAISD